MSHVGQRTVCQDSIISQLLSVLGVDCDHFGREGVVDKTKGLECPFGVKF